MEPGALYMPYHPMQHLPHQTAVLVSTAFAVLHRFFMGGRMLQLANLGSDGYVIMSA